MNFVHDPSIEFFLFRGFGFECDVPNGNKNISFNFDVKKLCVHIFMGDGEREREQTKNTHIKIAFMPNEEETYDFNLATFFCLVRNKELQIINKMQFNIIFIDCK